MTTGLSLTLITILLFVPPFIRGGEAKADKDAKSVVSDEQSVTVLGSGSVSDTDAIKSVELDVLSVAAPHSEEPKYSSTFADTIVSYVSPYVYVYASADEESEPVGILKPITSAKIVLKGDDWTKVELGEVTGYVKNTSVLFGYEAETVAKEFGVTLGYIKDADAQVYDLASSDGQVLGTIPAGANIYCVGYDENYTRVSYEDLEGFVKNELIRYEYAIERGQTMEEYKAEELAKELAAQEEERRKEEERLAEEAREQALVQQGLDRYIATEQREAVSLSDEDLWMLACIVKYESGWQPYEGKLAVANVVLNRMKKSGLSISSVIYAPYQFSGVANLDGTPSEYFYNNYLTKELSYRLSESNAEECMRAAVEAASGINNIGDFRYFIGTASADYGSYADYKTIAGHVFYTY